MSTVYDWNPLFEAINNSTNQWSQRNQYQAMLQGLIGNKVPGQNMSGAPAMAPQQTSIDATAPQIPGAQAPVQRSVNATLPGMAGSAPTQGAPSYDGMAGQALGGSAAALLPMLRNAPPSVGLPLLLNLATKNAERKQGIEDAHITTLSDDQAKLELGAAWKPDAKYGKDISGNIVTIQKGETLSDAAVQQQYGMKRQEGVIAADAPLTKEQDLAHQDRMKQIAVTASQPHFVPYGTSSYIQNGKLMQVGGGPGGGASPFGVGDPKAASINGQTGLSSMGYNYITGNTSQMGMRDKGLASQEVDRFIARTGLDAATVKPQVQAFQSAVNMNTLKANTMDTLAKEVTGTVQNYGPVIDQLTGSGNLRLTNQGFQLLGSAVNDPTAQKAIFYLNQMRADMAGFNAASGGKIGVHGQTQTDNADFAKADEVIKNGLSSGGAKALAEAIEATRQKNVAVAKQQVVEANRGIWNALGVGANFDAVHGAPQPAPAAGGSPVGGGAPVKIMNDADYAKLPSGAVFVGPDGHQRKKP